TCDARGTAGAYVCGYELDGEFVITATKAGFADAEGTVTVADRGDGCHVAGETLTLTLSSEGPAFPD
ncbi:MAG TPA: hypothetical protein VGF99_03560, partial [Myxococcota bacterium]